jgi:hypothetical protein
MKVIKPVAVTDAVLISSTAPETDYSAWAAGTAYSVGNRVIRTSTHRIYERLIAGTTATAPELDAVNWIDIAPTNRWAMFDSEVSTQTALASPLTVVIKPGFVNGIALFGLVGDSLTVTVRDGLAGSVVYSRTLALDGTILADWYQYFFEPYVQRADVVLTDLPPYGDAHITLTLTGSGTVKCGIVALGTVYTLGDTQQGASVSIVDYSRKETDAFGVTSFVQRAYSKRMSVNLLLANAQLNKTQRVLADLRASPAAWVGTDAPGYEPLTVYGFYKDFSIDIAYPQLSYCSLEIEGLT